MLDQLLLPDDILADLWRRLQQARSDPQHPFHLPALASVNEIDGVTVRTVVLRKVDPEARTLVFHTDRRSSKFADLLQDPTIACLFYEPKERLQLRVHARATLHTQDAIAHEQWVAASPNTRSMYRTALVPGSVVDRLQVSPAPQVGDGRDNFAVVVGHIETIDWLYLHPDAHRRARFTWPEGKRTCEWLAP